MENDKWKMFFEPFCLKISRYIIAGGQTGARSQALLGDVVPTPVAPEGQNRRLYHE